MRVTVQFHTQIEFEERPGPCLAVWSLGEVDCWLLSDAAEGGAQLPVPETFLSQAELERLGAMSDTGRAAQFLRARWYSKRILAACLGCSTGDIQFELNENGKPSLLGSPLHFNLTHTEGWFGMAVSRTRPVGIDLERRREVSHLDRISRKFYSPNELAMLDTTESKEERSALFLRLWSAKEAIIKGQGGGVFRHVLETQMRLSEGGLLEPVQVAGGGRAVDWQIHELQVEPEVVGMLAVGPEANHPI